MDLSEGAEGLPIGSNWWKFDRYEVVEDTHIAPAEDAELIRYDPFEAHEERWGGRRLEGKPPYLKLAEVDPFEIDEILEWCTQHGLLGLLPHRTLAVYFWPVWGGMITGGGVGVMGGNLGLDDTGAPGRPLDASGPEAHGRHAHQRIYRWGQGGGWDRVSGPVVPPEDAQPDEEEGANQENDGADPREEVRDLSGEAADAPLEPPAPPEGEPLSPEAMGRAQSRAFWNAPPLRRPGARIRRLRAEGIEWTDFAEAYAQFFPRRRLVSEWVTAHDSPFQSSDPPDNPFARPRQSERHRQAKWRLERAEYPVPDEEAFLREYGEPIPLLQRYIRQIRDAYEVWEDVEEVEAYEELPKAVRSVQTSEARHPIFEEFRASLQGVSPNAVPEREEGGGYRWPPSWHVPSLYAALNVMMLQDFTRRNLRAKRCLNCDGRFTTTNAGKKYCSDRCGNQYRVRKHRAKESEGEEEGG